MLGLETLPAVLYFCALFAVPESPRWLVMKGRISEGLDIMTRASGAVEAEKDLQAVQASLDADAAKDKVGLSALFAPALKLALLIGIVIAVVQQITGINAVFFYAPMIFEQSGIGTNASFIQAILVGLVNLVFTVVAIALIDRLGRKPLLILGLTGITIAMTVLAYGFYSASYMLPVDATLPAAINQQAIQPILDITYNSDVAFKQAIENVLGISAAREFESELIAAAISMNPILILTGILGFVASFAISLGPVMWVLFSELFPNRVRALAISFVGLINSAVSFTVQLIFPWELANLGSGTTFLLYGIMASLGLIFVIFVLPETKGRSLESLENLLSGELKAESK